MRRTISRLATAAICTVAFCLQANAQEQDQRMDADEELNYRVSIDGKVVGWMKSPTKSSKDVVLKGKKILQNSREEKNSDVRQAEGVALSSKGKGEIAMEEMTLMAEDWQAWLTSSMRGDITLKRGVVGSASKDLRKDITIEMFKPDGTPVRAVDFNDAYVTEIIFPSLDATNKDPAYMTIKIASSDTKVRKIPGRTTYQPITLKKAKSWSASNFKIAIGDLPCDRVTKISPLTWKQNVVKDEVGKFREPAKTTEQTRTGDTRNIKLTLPMSDWDAWEKWMTSSLLSKTELKEASITVMDREGNEGYMINFHDVTLVGMQVELTDALIDDIQRFVVEIHYNETDFNFISR